MKTPSFRLDGKRALVTGGSKGIGLAAAHALVQAGAEVVIAARNTPELIAACADITPASGLKDPKISYQTVDVLDSGAVNQLFASKGVFDIVINNAGTNRPKLIEDSSDEDLDAVIDLNVKAAFYVLRAAARSLKLAGKSGSLINISSQMGHVGGPKRAMYCASKHALEGMTKALAWELGGHGIRVNSICPTFIETELTSPMLSDPDFKSFVTSKIALGRVGKLEEIMGAVVFLASDASSLMTGSALMLDGGWTAS
ncbi:SDR family oxidoreductase [Variovorax sp. PCZ-1]|uniref:SDR family NAD(P)-dependent oxidoreductase n=1 Tax=Variovorax sp. PCZ-1 TaxID=2835533 RepID=UPI001BCB4D83|nr:SDR family oxidoreductase [Variovorax sp. PCZ-1]MBS7807904.1 SDR family oxidoreductase [Variovorax sp. PCZ-1]